MKKSGSKIVRRWMLCDFEFGTNKPANIQQTIASHEYDTVDANRSPWNKIETKQNRNDGVVVQWVYFGKNVIDIVIRVTTEMGQGWL